MCVEVCDGVSAWLPKPIATEGSSTFGRLEDERLRPDPRYSNTYAFSYEMLDEWTNLCGIKGQAWWTFWRNTLLQYHGHDSAERKGLLKNGYRHFQGATLDFVQLQNIDYRKSFQCEHAGKRVQFDGITIGFQRSRCCVACPWAASEDGACTYGSRFDQRLAVKAKKHRDALLALVVAKKFPSGLPTASFQTLMAEFQQQPEGTIERSMVGILGLSQSDAGVMRVLPAAKSLITSLGQPTPACAIVRPTTWADINYLVEGGVMTMSKFKLIHDSAPGVASLIEEFLGRALPSDYRALLKALVSIAQQCFIPSPPSTSRSKSAKATNPRITRVHPPTDPSTWSMEETFLRTGVWSSGGADTPWEPSTLGGSDVKRPLRRYHADEVSARSAESSDVKTCTKHKESKNRLLPGCLFGWCLDCGVCVGFTLMADAESPRTVFDLLLTRWDFAPELVFYDNGCNLQPFCLNREPEFFKDTAFYVDTMHFRDHNRCALEYNSATCLTIDNSSMAERKNSILRHLECCCGYMAQCTFLWYVRFFLYRLNEVQRSKLNGTCFFSKK